MVARGDTAITPQVDKWSKAVSTSALRDPASTVEPALQLEGRARQKRLAFCWKGSIGGCQTARHECVTQPPLRLLPIRGSSWGGARIVRTSGDERKGWIIRVKLTRCVTRNAERRGTARGPLLDRARQDERLNSHEGQRKACEARLRPRGSG